MLDKQVTTLMGYCYAVAGDVFDGVLFKTIFFPRDVLIEIWDRIE